MLNVSPIGRSCSQEERIEFYELDKVSPFEIPRVCEDQVCRFVAVVGVCFLHINAIDNQYLSVFLRKKIYDNNL